MIARYNRISFAFGIPGLILPPVVVIMAAYVWPGDHQSLTMLMALAGNLLLLIGLAYYAKAKGRHPAWCLFFFVSVFGLIVLAALEDRAPNQETPIDEAPPRPLR